MIEGREKAMDARRVASREMMRDLMNVQVSRLAAHLASGEIDPALVVEHAETLIMYAECLHDFPVLPGVMVSEYPAPPPAFAKLLSP